MKSKMSSKILPDMKVMNKIVSELENIYAHGAIACLSNVCHRAYDGEFSLEQLAFIIRSFCARGGLKEFIFEESLIIFSNNTDSEDENNLMKKEINYDELFKKFKAGDMNARDEIIVQSMPIVDFIANRYSMPAMEHDDLVQEGMVGLIRAVDKFDPGRGVKFTTYAYYQISYAVKKAIAAEVNHYRIPERIIGFIRKMKKTEIELKQKYNYDGGITSVAYLCGAREEDIADIKKALSVLAPKVPIDSVVDDDGEGILMCEIISDDDPENDPVERAERSAEKKQVMSMIKKIEESLSDDEIDILSMRYDDKLRPISAEYLGDFLGVPVKKVYELDRKLKKILKTDMPDIA